MTSDLPVTVAGRSALLQVQAQLENGIFRLFQLFPGCAALHGQHRAAHADIGRCQLQQHIQPRNRPAGGIIVGFAALGHFLFRPGRNAAGIGDLQLRQHLTADSVSCKALVRIGRILAPRLTDTLKIVAQLFDASALLLFFPSVTLITTAVVSSISNFFSAF